ncbi:hypothetical protein DL766_005817 [Monosporascus sp. MC13-8B]|nr:hypothetical protein DL763_009074 [Monosporascus cannonballus]RYP28531.1 hypothetical protein DL766_005817 [Monosporascus sp. MC13-8B]
MAPSRAFFARSAPLRRAPRNLATIFCNKTAAAPRPYHSHDHPPPPGVFNAAENAILSAAYAHVSEHGFTQRALSHGARDAGYPDISTNLLPEGPFSLIRYHLVTQREALAPKSKEIFNINPATTPASHNGDAASATHWKVGDKVERLAWERLLGNRDVNHRWQEPPKPHSLSGAMSVSIGSDSLAVPSPHGTQHATPHHTPTRPCLRSLAHRCPRHAQALAVMAQPSRVAASLHELALLADEIWYLSGDIAVDPSWYAKRGALSAVYASSELFMTNDRSPGYGETRAFLRRRLDETNAVGAALGGAAQWVGFTASAALNVLRSKGARI